MKVLQQGRTCGVEIAAPCNGAALSVHAPGEDLPWHQHSGAYICVVLAGRFIETAGAREARRLPGDIVFHPAGERHADRFEEIGGRCLNLYLPRDAVARPEVRQANAAFRAAAENLSLQSALGSGGDTLAAEAARAEMLDILFNRGSRRAPIAVSRVLRTLDEDPQRHWTLAELARIAGRHPTHLARAFREATGMSIGAYRRRRRLLELCLSLRATRESLGSLAHAHGYADQAHMTREFRRLAGCTPGSWRRRFR